MTRVPALLAGALGGLVLVALGRRAWVRLGEIEAELAASDAELATRD